MKLLLRGAMSLWDKSLRDMHLANDSFDGLIFLFSSNWIVLLLTDVSLEEIYFWQFSEKMVWLSDLWVLLVLLEFLGGSVIRIISL